MRKDQIALTQSGEWVALVWKAGSRSILRDSIRVRRQRRRDTYSGQVPVIMYCRHPLERLVSAWSFVTTKEWFDFRHDPSIPDDVAKELLVEKDFGDWVRLALQYKNPHWMPVCEIHHRWREYQLRPLSEYRGPLHNKGSWTVDWESYYDEDLKLLALDYYAGDMEIWRACVKIHETKELSNGYEIREGSDSGLGEDQGSFQGTA